MARLLPWKDIALVVAMIGFGFAFSLLRREQLRDKTTEIREQIEQMRKDDPALFNGDKNGQMEASLMQLLDLMKSHVLIIPGCPCPKVVFYNDQLYQLAAYRGVYDDFAETNFQNIIYETVNLPTPTSRLSDRMGIEIFDSVRRKNRNHPVPTKFLREEELSGMGLLSMMTVVQPEARDVSTRVELIVESSNFKTGEIIRIWRRRTLEGSPHDRREAAHQVVDEWRVDFDKIFDELHERLEHPGRHVSPPEKQDFY